MFHAVELSTIAACVGDQWSPQIGDPTVAGWATVVAYALCTVLGFMTLLRVKDRREWIFWGLVTLAMLSLGVNKQLDLQSMLTAAGRCLSQLQGWYDERRAFQRDFIIGLLITAGLFLALVLWLMRRYLRRNGLALLGLAFVITFVAVRAVGFHHFDVLINSRLLNIRFNVLFELSGLVLLAVNATALLGSRLSDAPSGRADRSDRHACPETEGDRQKILTASLLGAQRSELDRRGSAAARWRQDCSVKNRPTKSGRSFRGVRDR